MLKKWAYKKYMDDGHVKYQCCACRGYFSTGDYLGYTHSEHGWVTCWKYCPLCGVEWEGAVKDGAETEDMLEGRRKQAREETYRRSTLPISGETRVWVIRETYCQRSEVVYVGALTFSAQQVLNRVRSYRDNWDNTAGVEIKATIEPYENVKGKHVHQRQ